MKKLFSIYIKTFILKVFLIFFIGFTYRIIIHHCLDINVFSDYTNNISILYYFSLFSLTVYIDQFFSYQYSIPTNVESNNIIKSFNNDPKTFNLVFTKDHNNSSSSQYSTDHSSKHSKAGRKHFTTNEKHVYLRPTVNGKGDILLVPGLDIGKHSSNSFSSRDNSGYVSNIPPKPKPSNLSTPSTMSPLFPNSQQSNTFNDSYCSHYGSPLPFNMSRESKWYTITEGSAIHSEPTVKVSADIDLEKKFKRNTLDTIDLADRRRRIIESVQFKIKEFNMSRSTTKTSISGKISSSLNYLDSNIVSKLLNEPTGVMDPQHMEAKTERERRAHLYKHSQHKEIFRQENERMIRYHMRFGIKK
jgi:hypothetical protein